MKNRKFTNIIRRQMSLFLFVKDYNGILIWHTIPLLVIGMKIFAHINQLYDDKLNGVVGFVYGAILLLTGFSITHIKFLRKYMHRHFKLCRSGKLTDDIKFVCTLWILTGMFNFFIQMSFVGDLTYRLLSLYLVQLPILFLMLQQKFFGYQVKKRKLIS